MIFFEPSFTLTNAVQPYFLKSVRKTAFILCLFQAACAPSGPLGEMTPREREEVINIRQKLVMKEPQNAEARVELGRALQEDRQFTSAVFHFRKAIEMQPGNASFHNMLGTALDDGGYLDEAMVEYQKALALDPAIPAIYYNIGSVLHEQVRVDEAIVQYKKAVELDRSYADAWFNLGRAEQTVHHYPEAIGAYNQYLLLKPPQRDVKRWRRAAEDALKEMGVSADEIAAIIQQGQLLQSGKIATPAVPEIVKPSAPAPVQPPAPAPVAAPPPAAAPAATPAPAPAAAPQQPAKKYLPPGQRPKEPPPMPEWRDDDPNNPKNRAKKTQP